MPVMDRLRHEIEFHDRQAQARAATFAGRPEALTFRDADYLGHETWIGPAFRRLGDVAGRDALDYGCGHGMAAVTLARRGARVAAFDLSAGYLHEARARARANGVSIRFVRADAECLPFPDRSFDRVWGNAILHHLDLPAAARELRRILRPGGVAVFCEPWGENPLLRWTRARVAYPGKERTPDERPLRLEHLRVLGRQFPRLEIQGYQLLGMARRVLGEGRLVGGLDSCDAFLLAWFPSLERFCRYVVLTLWA